MSDAPEKSAKISTKTLTAGTGGAVKKMAGRYLFWGIAAAVASLIFFLWLAEEVFEGETKLFDETIRQIVHRAATPALTQLMIFLSLCGSAVFIIVGLIAAAIVFLRWRRRREVLLLMITMGGDVVLETVLKLFFQRLRPEPFFNYPLPASYSFPSGHALGSFCFYGILAWLIARRTKSLVWKSLIWTAAAALVLLIGLSRIYLGVHFPSDVLAGFAAAFVWVFAVALSDYFFEKKRSAN